MATAPPIPTAIQRAYAILRSTNCCDVLTPLNAGSEGLIFFKFRVNLPVDNQERLPSQVTITAVLRDTFPMSPVEFIPDDQSVRGFPHQDAETGKLCLPTEHLAPWTEDRLVTYVRWVIEWLNDAANGNLLPLGDPYELPDFSRKRISAPWPARYPLLFDESPETYPYWQHRNGETGLVELAVLQHPNVLVARHFKASDGVSIRTGAFTNSFLRGSPVLNARWTLFPAVTVYRHRPPQTYAELRTLFDSHGVSLSRTLRKAWANGDRQRRFGILLLGFPIPQIVGEHVAEVHWQPMVFPNKEGVKRSVPATIRKRDEGQLWNYSWDHGCFAAQRPVLWCQAVNVNRERLYARGSLPRAICHRRVALFGCGALGSIIAEALARAGVQDLSMFDRDTLEFGNLCRHTLDGAAVGRAKAVAMAQRLTRCNPLSHISGYDVSLPISDRDESSLNARRNITQAEVFVDCTTDHGAFLWLSQLAKGRHKPMASLFINPHASMLTLVLSGKQTGCEKVHRRLMQDIEGCKTPIDPSTYFADLPADEVIIPGAGCWHPTFPAINHHIWLLAFGAIERVLSWMAAPETCDGLGVLIRRNKAPAVGPLLETIWEMPYR